MLTIAISSSILVEMLQLQVTALLISCCRWNGMVCQHSLICSVMIVVDLTWTDGYDGDLFHYCTFVSLAPVGASVLLCCLDE